MLFQVGLVPASKTRPHPSHNHNSMPELVASLPSVRRRNQSSPLAQRGRCGDTTNHGEAEKTNFIYDCKHFVLRFFLRICTRLILGLVPQTKPPIMTVHHGLVTSHMGGGWAAERFLTMRTFRVARSWPCLRVAVEPARSQVPCLGRYLPPQSACLRPLPMFFSHLRASSSIYGRKVRCTKKFVQF